jgi:hypothetical protein
VREHTPAQHRRDPLQRTPQLPQLLSSFAVSVSQPSPIMPLQSLKPVLHDPIVHVADMHAGAAFGTMHIVGQLPQCRGSEARSASQPVAGIVSQSSNPASQRSMVHEPDSQLPVA